jgi:hypothetical protein
MDDGSEDGLSHHGSPGNASEGSCSHEGSPERSTDKVPKQKRKRCICPCWGDLATFGKKKRVKSNATKTNNTNSKNVKAAMTYTNDIVLQHWGDTTEYGKSFRLLNEEQQSAEVALLNKGSAKSMKNIIKTKLLDVHYQTLVQEKLRQYLSDGRVSQDSMFRCAPKLCNSVTANLTFLSVGEWVEVDGDRSPGFNSEGGIGVITNVHDDFADIK